MPTIKDISSPTNDESVLESLEKSLKGRSTPEQLAIGGVVGGISGMISMKIGKTVATVVGGSILLIQLGCHLGYVNVNWAKVKKDVAEVSNNADVNRKLSVYSRTFAKVQKAVASTPYFSSGFIGGFLLGLAL